MFSVLAWLTFAVLLLGRARFGWRGRTARRVLYAGSVLLLLAYVGSRFVLEVVLGRAAMKYLLALRGACSIAIWLWRNNRRERRAQRAPPRQAAPAPRRAAGHGALRPLRPAPAAPPTPSPAATARVYCSQRAPAGAARHEPCAAAWSRAEPLDWHLRPPELRRRRTVSPC